MATPPVEISPEETIARITELAKSGQNKDRFLVKVGKRRSASGVFENVAEFAEGTAFHLSSPEVWLHQIMGGGEYKLKAYHMEAPTLQIGGTLQTTIPGPQGQMPNKAAMDQNDWLGPRLVTFLAGPNAQPQVFAQAPALAPAPAYAPAPQVGYAQPQQMAQGYGVPVQAQPQQTQFVPQLDRETQAWVRQRESELAAKEAKIAREQSEREAELKRIEGENRLREENARNLRELELKLAAQAPKPQENNNIEKAITIGTPLILAYLKEQADARREEARMQREAQERADRRFEELAKTLATKPAMSEEMKLLLETMRGQGTANAEQMKHFLDATSIVTKNSVAMIETISNLKFGDEPEHPAILAIREGVSAIRAMSAGAQGGQRRQQQALPPPTQPFVQQATAPVPVAQAPAGAVATAPQAFNGLAQQPPPGTPPGASAPRQLTEGEARFILQRGQPPGQQENPIEVLVLGVRAHHNPVEVATYLFASVKHPVLNAALKAVGGDPDAILLQYLGEQWMTAPENIPYMMQLGRVVQDIGEKTGAFGPPEGEPAAAAGQFEDDGEDDLPEDDEDENEEIPPPAQQIVNAVPQQLAQPVAVVPFPAKK